MRRRVVVCDVDSRFCGRSCRCWCCARFLTEITVVAFVADAKILACAVHAPAVNAAVSDAFVAAILTSASMVTADTTIAMIRAVGVLTRAVSAFVGTVTLVDVSIAVGAFPSSGAVTAVAGDVIVAGGIILAGV